jgi:flagellin-like hook-associated protein FlgL
MRISDNQLSSMIYNSTMRNLSEMARVQEMASSGYRVNHYADDPKGVGLIQEYETMLARNAQYQRNIDRSRVIVQQTDAAMLDLLDVLRDANEIASMAGSETLSDWQMDAIAATQIDGLIQQAQSIMNQSVEGNYLFGGFRTDIEPFIEVGGQIIYQGDYNDILVNIGPNTDIAVNMPGSELLGSDRSHLTGTTDMSPRLDATTSLSAIGNGAGWSAGTIIYTDGTDTEYTLDLSGAGTVGDIVNLLNDAGLTASINADGTGLTVIDPGGGPLSIRDLDGETTALSLGIAGSSVNGQIDGIDIRTNPELTTNLSDIAGMDGQLPLDFMLVTIDSQEILVDLTAAATVGDIKTSFETAISAAGVGPLYMELSGTALSIYSETGQSFEVSALPAAVSASSLGLEGIGRPARLFDSLQSLSTALRLGDRDGVLAAMNEFDALEQHILELEIQTGGRETTLDWMENHLSERDLHLQNSLALIRDADIVKVASDLSRAETAYQASLLVSGKLMQTNLLDYL